MFGVLHPGHDADLRKPPVLIFKPFGQEAVRSHRMLRVLSERLAQAGHTTLRFDYFGTGDSMGDDLDGDLEGWVGDSLAADDMLKQHSGASEAVWIGLRMGANLALLASERRATGPARMVLWDPIVNGKEYLDALRRQHVLALEYAMGGMPTRHAARAGPADQDEADGYIGFAVSARLRLQLKALTLNADAWPRRQVPVSALADLSSHEGLQLLAALPPESGAIEVADLRHGIDWTTDVADGSLISPSALSELVRRVAGAAA